MNKFEKVSFEQYNKAIGGDADLRPEYEAIQIPRRATKYAAGYDFFAPFDFELRPGETITIPTGIKCRMDPDTFLMILPRSGLGFKYRLQLDNTCGIVDADYVLAPNEGHIFVKLTNNSYEGKTLEMKAGQAFVQGILMKYLTAEEAPVTTIRDGGFGSTDK